MNMWCHLPTGYIRRFVLQFVALLLIFVALFTTLILAPVSNAVVSTNKTINFQGRLLTSGGAIVADGNYNIQFKIYQDGSGNAAGNPGGSLKWTESYVNAGNDSGVEVRNGYFSVSLGSLNQFGSSVDWSQDTLWLSMNVAGNSPTCTTFGTAPCTADGEMLQMKRITATPNAIQAENANKLNGLTSSDLIQNTTSPQTGNIAIQSSGPTNVAALIQGAPLQSADIIQIKSAEAEASLLYVSSSGKTTLQNSVNSTDAFNVKNADGNNLFTVDTENSRVGINLGYGNTPTLAATGLEVQGALRLSGGGDVNNVDNYITPMGSSVKTKINIPSYDPTAYGQILAMGIPATADSTSRVISLFDARTGINNQPTLSVFSPDENQYVGFSWDGSNTTAKIKTSADNLTLQAGGQDLVTASKDGNNGVLSLGNGVSSDTPSDFKIQGTASSANGVNGGALTIQGGGTTVGNADGGNLTLSGGNGSGTGTGGLVVIGSPTFTSAGTQTSATNVNVTQANVDSFGVVTLNATVAGVNFTLGAPSLGANAKGRIIYVTAENGSQNFILRANTGAGSGVEQAITMKQNTTTTMIWSGTIWTSAGSSNPTTLQNAYDASQNTASDTDISLYNNLTLRNVNTQPTNNVVLQVQSSSTQKLFSINSGAAENASNSGAEIAGATSSTFPGGTWTTVGTSTVSRNTTPGKNINSGTASVAVTSSGVYSGGLNILKTPLLPGKTYSVSLSARLDSGTFTDFAIFYIKDNSALASTCQNNITLSTTEWKKITCTFVTPADGITADNTIAFGQVGEGSHTYFVDDLSVVAIDDSSAGPASATPNIQIGNGSGTDTTLFTLDKSNSAPTAASNEALLGSMYYDTTLGKVQCFESEGWGACGSSPDTFVTLSPEYSNSVMNGSDTGTLTNGICSDALNINDGSSSQPTICGTNETNNFYKWTTPSTTSQTRSIFVTYQLPSNFKSFADGSTSVMARTDSTSSNVDYQIYRNNASGLTACGSAIPVSTGNKTTWQKVATSGASEPSKCDFSPGDSIVVRVNMSSLNNANAYVGNLNFVFSNQ